MTPKEKAKERVEKYISVNGNSFFAKECALTEADEILSVIGSSEFSEYAFWLEEKQEIEKL